MAKVTERLSAWAMPKLFPGKVREIDRMISIFEDAYERGGLLVPPEQVLARLTENGQLTDLLMRLRGTTFASGFAFSDSDRKASIDWHEFMFATNVNIESAVNMWTDFGMGRKVSISSPDNSANDIVSEFVSSRRNRPVLGIRNQQQMSIDALNRGELAYALWYSPLDKLATMRPVNTQKLTIIWEDEETKLVPLFYVEETKTGSRYYPDWLADSASLDKVTIPQGATRTDKQVEGGSFMINGRQTPQTLAVMVWARRNQINGRGLPQFLNGLEWAKVLQQFMGDRAAVSRKAAMYTETITVDGGSRVLASLRNQLQSGLVTSNQFTDSNPPPAAASDWIQNKGVTREWQTRDTGATSARFDGRMLAGQLSVDTGIPLHWMGFPDALSNRSTSQEMKIPWLEQIKRYRSWLESVFDDIARAVLMIAEYPAWETVLIDIGLDTPINVILDELALVLNVVISSVDSGLIGRNVGENVAASLIKLAITKTGIANVNDLMAENDGALSAIIMQNYRNGSIGDKEVLLSIVGEYLEELADVA